MMCQSNIWPWLKSYFFLKQCLNDLMRMYLKARKSVKRFLVSLTLEAPRGLLACGGGGTGRQLTPFHLLTALPCRVGGAVTGEVIPHGVAHAAIETGVNLQERKKLNIKVCHDRECLNDNLPEL